MTTTIQQSITDFLTQMSSRSKKTGITYRTALNHLQTYLDEETDISLTKQSPDQLTFGLLMAYKSWLLMRNYTITQTGEEKSLSQNTLKLYLVAVQRYIEFLLRRKLINWEYADFMTLGKEYGEAAQFQRDPIDERMPDEETIDKLIALVTAEPPEDETLKPEEKHRRDLIRLRNIALLLTLVNAGMRVSELVSLRTSNLQQQDYEWGAWITGKRSKRRFVPISEGAYLAIEAYLAARGDGMSADVPIFISHSYRTKGKKRPMTTVSVQRIIRELRAEAGVTIQLTPHSFRHAFARRLLDTVKDLAIVQSALGHSHLSTTGIYTKPRPGEVARAVAKAERARTIEQEQREDEA